MASGNDPVASPAHSEHLISTHGQFAERIWNPSEPLSNFTVENLINGCAALNEERCGLISSGGVTYWIDNVHEQPSHNFYMDQTQYVMSVDSIFSNCEDILGVFHSHPNNTPWPTPRDIRGWPPFQLGWRYFIVTQNEVIEWKLA